MTYVHRIGRTARAGAQGNAVTFVDWDDIPRWKLICDELDLPFHEPVETYSTSPHLYSSWTSRRATKGTLPRAERTRAGLDAEELEDLGGRATAHRAPERSGPARRAARAARAAGPAGRATVTASAPAAGSRWPGRTRAAPSEPATGRGRREPNRASSSSRRRRRGGARPRARPGRRGDGEPGRRRARLRSEREHSALGASCRRAQRSEHAA